MIEGYENLQGTEINSLLVIQRARLNPLAWLCRCRVCGTEQIVRHTLLQAGTRCANGGCGKVTKPDKPPGSTGVIPYSVRSRDAEDAARHTHEQEHQVSPETQRVIDELGTFAAGARECYGA